MRNEFAYCRRRSKFKNMAEGVCTSADEEGCSVAAKVPITLTYVLYNQGDNVGMVLAWSSLLPIFILVGFATLILFHRDLHTIFYFGGLILNEGLNFGLKHVIRDPRPNTELLKNPLFVEYGMPSSHAQFMAFFAIYFTIFLSIRVKLSSGVNDYIWKGLTMAMVIFGAIMSCVSRVYLGYHSSVQVLCGVLIGCIMGVAWFQIVHFLITPFLPKICSWSLSELCLLKDVSAIPNYLWFEYTSARLEARKRNRTKSG